MSMANYSDLDDFTQLSREAYESAVYGDIAPDQVKDWMRVHMFPRSFGDILKKYGTDEEIKKELCDGLVQNDPSAKLESIARNVRDWLSGKRAPTDRSVLWQIAFILCDDLWAADDFLAASGETGIHWRDTKEITYAFALRNKMTWTQAQELLQRVSTEIVSEPNEQNDKLTALYERDFHGLGDNEIALKNYLAQEAGRMGTFHLKAKKYYDELLKQLRHDDRTSDDNISVRKILEMYFHEYKDRYPSAAKAKHISDIHGALMQDWPNEFIMSRISNGVIDVPRKVLMMLFLATDGFIDGADPDCYDINDVILETDDGDIEFIDAYERMNNMLIDCGYRKLDPRNPFDWIMIYCMRDRGEDDCTFDEILKQILESFFPEET